MNYKKIIVLLFFIILTLSCVTKKSSLPSWAEIKPSNTDKEIFFSYGPAENRDRAKEGLYKEISEYFGVKVSSVDQFVKEVTVENGVTDISQTKESQIDVSSREKGLESIEILEIWSDNNDSRWCILASLSREAEEKIKQEVEEEIEAERVAEVLALSEKYSAESDAKYKMIEEKIAEYKKLELQLIQSINKVSEISEPSNIINESQKGIKVGDELDTISQDISRLLNEIKLSHNKNILLENQLTGNSIALLELDFYLNQSSKILKNSEDKVGAIEDTLLSVESYRDELNTYYSNAELTIVSNEESIKRELKSDIENIDTSISNITTLKGETELLYNQSQDLLLSLKQVADSVSISDTDKNDKVNELLIQLEDTFNKARVKVDSSFLLKESILSSSGNIYKSSNITNEEISEIKRKVNKINSPISWIEIYKDKIAANLNSGKKIKNNL